MAFLVLFINRSLKLEMKIYQFIIFLLFLASCGFSLKGDEDLSEFNFPPSYPVDNPGSFALAYIESDTILVGETFRTKIFLANKHNVESPDCSEPIIRFQFEEDYTNNNDLLDKAERVKVINDTAYVKRVLGNEGLKKGESKVKRWYASITIPCQPSDSLFTLVHKFVLFNK